MNVYHPCLTDASIGQPFVKDGIECQLVRDEYRATYPYPHYVVGFYATPTAIGMKSDRYCQERSRLGDDWSFHLTDSESLIPSMRQARLTDEQIAAVLDDAHQLRMAVLS